MADMDKPTPEEIEAAVRRGCRGLPEAVVRLNIAEALREGIIVDNIMVAESGGIEVVGSVIEINGVKVS